MTSRHLLSISAVLSLISACGPLDGLSDTQRLKHWTDIDLIGTDIVVSTVLRKDLDEPSYSIVVAKDGKRVFEQALQSAAGKDCAQTVADGPGCYYKSNAGHNVFVNSIGSLKYTISTSG